MAFDEEGVRVAIVAKFHQDPPDVCRVELSRNLKNNRKAAPLSVCLFLLLLVSFACLPQPAACQRSIRNGDEPKRLPSTCFACPDGSGRPGRVADQDGMRSIMDDRVTVFKYGQPMQIWRIC